MKKYKYYIIAAAALMLAACADERSSDSWEPGEPSANPGVSFSPSNDRYITLLDGNSSVASIALTRLDTRGALTVPVVVKEAEPHMVIPPTVTFADGSATASLDIDCSTMPVLEEFSLVLTFPEEYLNPYANGGFEYVGRVIASHWENTAASGTTPFEIINWSNNNKAGYLPYEGQVLRLAGSDRYMAPDFMGSGVDFKFELMPSPLQAGYYRIVPLGNQLLLRDYGWGDYSYYNSWWLVTDDFNIDADDDSDENDNAWPVITLTKADNSQVDLYNIEFFWYDEQTNKAEFCYATGIGTASPKAYMSFNACLDEDMTTYFGYYRIRFALKS